jgi:hypothetical protein
MPNNESRSSFEIVPLPDTPDSRLFVELSSYAADLVEARHALTLALRSLTDGSSLAEATQHLVGLAAIAYCRTATVSNVRGRLTDQIQLPDQLVEIHRRIRIYRNATVAHSQSELAVTYAIGVLEPTTLEARDVMAVTVLVPAPNQLILEFLALVETAEGLLDEAIEPLRERLKDSLARMDRADIEAITNPEIRHKQAPDFDPNTRRARHPTGHTIYWAPEPATSSHNRVDLDATKSRRTDVPLFGPGFSSCSGPVAEDASREE